MSPTVPVTCPECGEVIDLPFETRRMPVAPVGEVRYAGRLDPTPLYAHLEGRPPFRAVPPPDEAR